MSAKRLSLFHLRQSAGSGGGADRVLAEWLSLAAGSAELTAGVVFLRHRNESLQSISDPIRSLGIPCHEVVTRHPLDLRQLGEIARIIERYGVEILHCHDPKSDLYGYLLRRRLPRLALVSTLHGWIQRRLRSRLYTALDLFALRRFDHVVAVAPTLASAAEEAGIAHATCIENGVDTDYWQPEPDAGTEGSQGGGVRMGFVGRLSREKDPETLLKSFALVAREHSAIKLFIAGDGPERGRMVELAERLGISGRIDYLGWLDAGDLKRLYSRLDILLLSSRSEGLPMAILEALAMRVPVVATRVGGVDRVVRHGETGLLAAPGDAEGLAAAVSRLASDRQLARALGEAGRRLVVERHSVIDSWRRYLEIYRRTADARQRGNRASDVRH